MAKLAQVGIAIAVLGGVITLIGLFPGVTGLEAAQGMGIIQTMVVLAGFSILIFGAYIFVQASYYPGVPHNLAQQIGVRLSMTGLVVAIASGLADVLGYGSHAPPEQRPFIGPWQAAGLIGGFLVASIGILIFALMGPDIPPDNGEPPAV